MTCPKCGYALSSFDKTCPRCAVAPNAVPVTPTQPARPVVAAPVAAKPAASANAAKGCALGCLALFVLFIVLPLSCTALFPSEKKFQDIPAYSRARENIRAQLKSPSTAVFPQSYDPSVRIVNDGTTGTILSYVDSQNGFGAMLRKKWFAKVRWEKSTNAYTVESATLIE